MKLVLQEIDVQTMHSAVVYGMLLSQALADYAGIILSIMATK